MAFIEYDELNPGAQYNTFRFGVMKAVWGAEKNPYLDIHTVPTIGTDFDMTVALDQFDIIAKGALGDRYTASLARQLWDVVQGGGFSTNAQLRSALDGVLADNEVSGHFAFANEGQMKTVLNGLETTQTAESELSWSDQDIPISEERAVVFSIAYEGVDISNILDAMLSIDPSTPPDRFKAWFEIRYDSNDASEASTAELHATAERRYIQSDLFELYNDPKHVGYNEAFDVARRYQQNRQTILAYEHQYNPNAAAGALSGAEAANGTGGNINDALQPAIAAITKHFGVATGHLDEVLYVRGASPNLTGDNSGFDSARNDDDLLIGDSANNTITGNVGNDVILGLGGNDDLTGGADNDQLYGHSGNDFLKGALGNDKLDGGADDDWNSTAFAPLAPSMPAAT